MYLCTKCEEHCSHGVDFPMIERLDDGDDVDRINTGDGRVCKDGDEAVLLYVEGPRIHGEGPFGAGNPHCLRREGGGHELPDGKDQDLSRDRGYRESILAVEEELVQE